MCAFVVHEAEGTVDEPRAALQACVRVVGAQVGTRSQSSFSLTVFGFSVNTLTYMRMTTFCHMSVTIGLAVVPSVAKINEKFKGEN